MTAPTPAPPRYEFSFTRRRYGRTTFTWVHVLSPTSGQWILLGDPYRAITPAAKTLHRDAQSVLEDEAQGLPVVYA